MVKTRILYILILISYGCKYLPNQTRTSGAKLSGDKIYNTEDIKFIRSTNFTAGTLKFELNPNYRCEVAYWSDNPNITPNRSSPITFRCPEGEGEEYRMYFPDLSLSDTYSFEIAAWPKGLDRELSTKYLFKENNENLNNFKISEYYIIQYNHHTKAMKMSYIKQTNILKFKDLKQEISSEIEENCSTNNYLKKAELAVAKLPISTIRSDGFLATDRTAEYNDSKFLKLKNLDIRQDWMLEFKDNRGSQSIILSKPQYIEKVSIKSGDESIKLSNYLFQGKIKDTVVSEAKTQVNVDLVETLNTDTLINTSINDKVSCQKYEGKPIEVSFKPKSNDLVISSINLSWLYSTTLESPVLLINTDQFISKILI